MYKKVLNGLLYKYTAGKENRTLKNIETQSMKQKLVKKKLTTDILEQEWILIYKFVRTDEQTRK